MAEFREVMRQFDRMCKSYAGCSDCPLHDQDGSSDRCSINAFVNDSEQIERELMSWAEEHPEPVYPTWLELVKTYETGEPKSDSDFIYWMGTSSIPADLAQRLGLEPKEKT